MSAHTKNNNIKNYYQWITSNKNIVKEEKKKKKKS